MAYGSILGQTTPVVGVGAAIISGVVNTGETINAGDVVNFFGASTSLSAVTPGTLVKLNENGNPVQFYVAAQNYESGLNGAGRTLLVRKDVYQNGQWNSTNVNAYANSTIDQWFNGTYKNQLDLWVQTAIGTTTFQYTPGNRNNTVTTLSRAVFALSVTELGLTYYLTNTEGSALPVASSLQIAEIGGSAIDQWTRSPFTTNQNSAGHLGTGGTVVNSNSGCLYSYGYRPAFTLPSSLYVSDDGTVSQTGAQLPGPITKQGTPYQAIALSSGTSGQTIQAICSGIINAQWVTAGQTITSTATGVQGYGVKDGMLEVFPYYRPQ